MKATKEKSLEKKNGESKKARYAMVIDLRRCLGCHSCSVACKSENAVPLGVYRSWVKQIQKGKYPLVSKSFLPSLCNNCENAICAQNCPVKATYRREDGIIMVDEHRCIGCLYCMYSCPYDARYINPLKQYVQKCFWCHHRVDVGLDPACVNTCPARARIFGDINDPDSEISQVLSVNPVQVLKPEKATSPHVFYIALDETAVRVRGLPLGGEE